MENKRKITVETAFGALVAQIGFSEEQPEINVFLRGKDGDEMMLARVTDKTKTHQSERDGMQVSVYGRADHDETTNIININRRAILERLAPVYRNVDELTRVEFEELREHYFYDAQDEAPETVEGMDSPEDVPDDAVLNHYQGIGFVVDDFFCNMAD